MIYGTKIKYFRDRNNIKEKDLSKVINKSKSLYSEYENERKTIPIRHLNTICNYLDVSLDYILSLNDNKQYNNIHKLEKLNSNIIGKRLKEIRKENKLTQKELGNIVGCSYGTIAGYESGRYLISVPVLYKICKKYNVSADYLLGRVDNPKCIK